MCTTCRGRGRIHRSMGAIQHIAPCPDCPPEEREKRLLMKRKRLEIRLKQARERLAVMS